MTRVVLAPDATIGWAANGLSITGLPLSDAGLDQLVVVHPDATRAVIVGLAVYPGETIAAALTRSFPGCQIVYSPLEAEQLRKGLP